VIPTHAASKQHATASKTDALREVTARHRSALSRKSSEPTTYSLDHQQVSGRGGRVAQAKPSSGTFGVMRLALKVPMLIVAALLLAEGASANSLHLKVQTKLSTRENVHLSFKASPLPEGGYYYAVVVLKAPYRGHDAVEEPPACALSSNMQRTDYGWPDHGTVLLALTPAKSHTRHWCPGGSYEGAIYAVPHPPPCESSYPCRAEPYEARPNRYGVTAKPGEWHWPDPLPPPLAKGTKIIDHFTIKFPKRS
jgi:hypothetical protein